MTIKEIQARSMSSYLGYILLVFCWYFLDNRFTSIKAGLPDSPLIALVNWGIILFTGPLLMAGVFGGIYAR